MNDSPSSSPQMAQSELSRFRQLLVTHFNRAELKELYFDLDVNYDALPGEGTRAKALELIYYMGKRGRLNELRSAAAHARQHVEWPDLSTVTFDFFAGRQQLSSAIDPFDVESRIQDLLDRFSKATRQEMRIVGGKYIPSLYFERLRVESNFKRFLASDAACFLVVAKAGRGKTNLMCHIVDELQEQRAVLFLSGRLEPRDNFGIVKHIAGRLGFGEDWSACFEAIKSLASHGPQPLILIDGINESAAEPSEMQAALRELLVQAGEEIKVCVTCRTDFWKFYRAPFWAEYTWQEEGLSYGPRVVRGEDLRPFPEQNFAQIVERYFAFFEVDGELVEEAWERCRNPLLLRFFCEAYRGRAVGIVSQIRLYPLFKLFWNLKVEHVQDMIGLAEQYQVNQFVLTVARLMRQRAQTRVPRDELEAEFGSDLIQPDSMYYRVLDEEIILEEEVDELVGRTNVIFVYDKFSEYAIALSIFADFQLGTSPGDVAVAELQRWMQEETDNQFATLRGALEFLVLCVEDRRPAEWLHFDLIRAMLGFDWKWRRIGGLLAWQLARTNHERYWQFAESLVRHERDFVKRISAEQLGSLSRYHADRALPLLNLCLQDDSASVRQAAEATLLNLSAEATIQEVQLLARQQPLGDGSLPLAGRLLLWPLDSRSPLLQAKVRWLIEVNQDVDIQTAVLGRLEFLESDSRIDLMAFEELQRAFQLGWKRDHRPRNRYLDLVDQQTERLRDALETDLHRLDVLRSVMRQLREFAITQFAMGRTNPGLVMESTLEILAPDISKREDFIGDVVRQFNVPLRQILSEMTNYWSEYYGWSGDRITIGDITLGQIAIEVARREPAFQESDQASLLTELPLAYYPYDATELVQLCLLADRTCLRLAQLSQNLFVTITLATEFGENGVNLGPDQRIAFRTEVAAEIGAELTGIDHRYLSTVGRLTIWLWQTEQQLREQELSLESRVEAFGRMNLDQLRQRFSIFETLSLTDQAQEDLAADLQALCRVPPAARLTAVLTPLIIWHYENDSSAVGQAFQTLYWRNRDGFWDLVNLLLEHEDQRVIDFASQVLEQAEYVEEQGGGSEIFDRVRGIVADLLGVYENEILPETRFREDLEADSLDLVELIMAFEEEFGGEISDEDAVRIVTVGDAVDLMARTELAS